MAEANKKDGKKLNPILWFLFAIILPGIVVVILTVIILTIAGVDVPGWAKETGNKVPVLENVIPADETESQQYTEEALNETITNKNDEIDALNQQITNLESNITDLEKKVSDLEADDAPPEEINEGEEAAGNEAVKTMSSSFEEMDNEQAAQILQNSEQALAVSILENLSDEVRGEVLEAMEPELAAELTQQFVNRTE